MNKNQKKTQKERFSCRYLLATRLLHRCHAGRNHTTAVVYPHTSNSLRMIPLAPFGIPSQKSPTKPRSYRLFSADILGALTPSTSLPSQQRKRLIRCKKLKTKTKQWKSTKVPTYLRKEEKKDKLRRVRMAHVSAGTFDARTICAVFVFL